jgi:hypothetical protein
MSVCFLGPPTYYAYDDSIDMPILWPLDPKIDDSDIFRPNKTLAIPYLPPTRLDSWRCRLIYLNKTLGVGALLLLVAESSIANHSELLYLTSSSWLILSLDSTNRRDNSSLRIKIASLAV